MIAREQERFLEVLGEGGPRAVRRLRIAMELEQPLGQPCVVEPPRFEQRFEQRPPRPGFAQAIERGAARGERRSERIVEREARQALDERHHGARRRVAGRRGRLGRAGRERPAARERGKQFVEHARGGSGGRHERRDGAPARRRLVPVDRGGEARFVEAHQAVSRRARAHQIGVAPRTGEQLELAVRLVRRDSARGEILAIGVAEAGTAARHPVAPRS